VGAPQQPGSLDAGSGAYTRLFAAFAAVGAGATAVVFGVLLVQGLPAIVTSASTSSAASAPATTPAAVPAAPAGYPAPPKGAVVFGAEAGLRVLGLSVVPGRGKIELQASVVGEQGNGLKGLSVSFDVAGTPGKKTTAAAKPCGAGCYRAVVPVARPTSVEVHLTGEKPVSFGMPATWPPAPATAIVSRAAAVWRNLVTLTFHDSLGDGHVVLNTVWKAVAPDRLEYTIESGGASILIGNTRWDRAPGSTRWVKSAQFPVHQPVPFWQSVTNAHLLGTVTYHGKPAWKISFFDPTGGPGWFTIVVDKSTLHTMDMSMTANAHFMHDTYGPFNAPIAINPPSSPSS
jgi:hypothetical protein